MNYFDYGPQNSRGFRALKVWLALRQVGAPGYLKMIGDDMRLAQHLHQLLADHPEFEATTQSLSITTFRYVPPDLRSQRRIASTVETLSQRAESGPADGASRKAARRSSRTRVIDGKFALRACIVNFHTSLADIEALPPLLSRLGREVDVRLRRDFKSDME